MTFSFLAREAGRVHLCGHRGYSLHYPENTLPALRSREGGGSDHGRGRRCANGRR